MADLRAAAPASSALIAAAAFSAGEAFESGESNLARSSGVGPGGQSGPISPPLIRVNGLVMPLRSWPSGDLQHLSRQALQPSLVMPSLFQMVGTCGAAGVAAPPAAGAAPGTGGVGAAPGTGTCAGARSARHAMPARPIRRDFQLSMI